MYVAPSDMRARGIIIHSRGIKSCWTHRSQSPVSRRRLRTASSVSASVDMLLLM